MDRFTRSLVWAERAVRDASVADDLLLWRAVKAYAVISILVGGALLGTAMAGAVSFVPGSAVIAVTGVVLMVANRHRTWLSAKLSLVALVATCASTLAAITPRGGLVPDWRAGVGLVLFLCALAALLTLANRMASALDRGFPRNAWRIDKAIVDELGRERR